MRYGTPGGRACAALAIPLRTGEGGRSGMNETANGKIFAHRDSSACFESFSSRGTIHESHNTGFGLRLIASAILRSSPTDGPPPSYSKTSPIQPAASASRPCSVSPLRAASLRRAARLRAMRMKTMTMRAPVSRNAGMSGVGPCAPRSDGDEFVPLPLPSPPDEDVEDEPLAVALPVSVWSAIAEGGLVWVAATASASVCDHQDQDGEGTKRLRV